VIAHVILFRPKATFTRVERTALATNLTEATKRIPAIRRVQVGRRVLTGQPYEGSMVEEYTHAAIIEFDDRAALDAYLAHPAHEGLAARFFAAVDTALIYDYELGGDVEALFDAP